VGSRRPRRRFDAGRVLAMNWQRWIRPGLLTTLIVTLVAVLVQSGPIARQLASAVNADLAAGGQAWAIADASARDVTLYGVAPTPESQQAAMRLAAAVPGVHAVRDATSLLPIASPYIWSGQRTGRKITLSGSVPSEGSRVSVLAVARRALPEAEIVDTMVPAWGAPEVFNAAVGFALGNLAGLSQGTVTLNDSTLVIQGVARSASDYSAVQAAVRTQVPKAVVMGPVEIQPPRADPFVWSATYDGTAVVLAGYVPNDLVRESLVAAVKATLPNVSVQDRAAVASGDPPGFADAATFAISTLKRLNRGGVTLDGLKLDVAGDAKSVDDYEAVVDGLSRALPDGVQLIDTGINPAVVSPYFWKAERADGRVILSGYVPTPQSRKDILALAQSLFGGDAIDSRLRVAAGEPRVDWLGGLKFALGQLARLSRGSVALNEKTYSIAGEAESSEAFAALTDASSGTLPASLTLKQADVVPPHVSPYRFVAVRRGTGIVLTGNVGSEVQHQRILDEVHRKFGSSEVTDQLTFASGEPDGFDMAVDALLQAMSRLSGGQAMVEDTAVTISGYTYYPSGTTQVVQELDAGLPDGFKVTADGVGAPQDDQPVSADQCRDLMQSVLALGSIGFDSGKSQLTKDSEGVLDRASRVIARCPDTAVEVGAHSDGVGGQAHNREITQARAETILEYLVAAGIKRERLTAVGYGETKPVADNATAAGKAANRRIEFTFTEPAG
jgi:OOP family OmpA-OmpF porin